MNSPKEKPSSLEQEPAEGSRQTVDRALKNDAQTRQTKPAAEQDGMSKNRKPARPKNR